MNKYSNESTEALDVNHKHKKKLTVIFIKKYKSAEACDSCLWFFTSAYMVIIFYQARGSYNPIIKIFINNLSLSTRYFL